MSYNPMSVDDYEAILWLEEKSRKLPALNNAWKVLKGYYEECKRSLNDEVTNVSPFQNNTEKDSIYNFVSEVINNEMFMSEVSDFLNISKENILKIIDEKESNFEKEWVIAKIARLYNMHLKLGHSARITFVAEQELENIPENENTELLRRTVLLSALLHDVGRFYQAANYNNLSDAYMKSSEDMIGELKVDHAIAGYYYSLASALELHKLVDCSEEEDIIKYVTEAISSVVVKCHQNSNSKISYFDYNGSSSVLDSSTLISDLKKFIDYSYDNSKLMNYRVNDKINPKHKEFIDNFVSKIKGILYDKELDYSVASGFEYNQSYTDTLYEELSRDIHYILEHSHGSNVSDVSSEIVEAVNKKVVELSHDDLKKEEKEQYKIEIEESLSGMLDYDIASSVEELFKNNIDIPNAVRFLISSSLSMTMDADKIDILNQRALGIYNTSYRINSFSIFPPKDNSLREILNNYYHFNLNSEEFEIDNKVINVIQKMNPKVLDMIHNKLGNVDVFDFDKFPQGSVIKVFKDKVIINGEEYPGNNLYNMFQDEWISYVSNNMNLDNSNYKDLKKNNYNILSISISRDDLDSNLSNCTDKEKMEAYKRLLVSDGMKKRFMLEEENGIQCGWINAVEDHDTDHIINSSISGLIWQLNQFIMVNMRNKHSYEFIEKYNMLDQIYEQYVAKDPLIAEIIKEYIDYCKKFMKQTLESVKDDTLTSDVLADMRKKVYDENNGNIKEETYLM